MKGPLFVSVEFVKMQGAIDHPALQVAVEYGLF